MSKRTARAKTTVTEEPAVEAPEVHVPAPEPEVATKAAPKKAASSKSSSTASSTKSVAPVAEPVVEEAPKPSSNFFYLFYQHSSICFVV